MNDAKCLKSGGEVRFLSFRAIGIPEAHGAVMCECRKGTKVKGLHAVKC